MWRQSLRTGRQVAGFVGGAMLLVALTAVLVRYRGDLAVGTSLTLYLLAVVGITAVGGRWPGLVAALSAPLLANWFLIPPYHTLRISDGDNLLELLVFVSVASIVAGFVTTAEHRAHEARRAWREAATLAALTESGAGEPLQRIIELLRSTFDLDGVAVLGPGPADVGTIAATGTRPPADPGAADVTVALGDDMVLAINGGPLDDDAQRVLRAFTGQLARALEQQRLHRLAMEAESLARADELRTALLRSVSHDLRSPLASIKASVSSLRQPDVEWPVDVRAEFLESIEVETDRLTRLISNLLDLSRLETGVLRPAMRPVPLEDIVPASVHSIGADAHRVVVDVPDDLPDVDADPALVDRVVANLLGNALKWSPADQVITLRARRVGDEVHLQVVDRGPGIPVDQRAVVIQPFHRLDDSKAGGLGLGLAIVDRMIVAMNGRLELRDTPGGGLTAVVVLHVHEGAR
ncbi:MAG: sensor histidine kinase [Ilumatobacteraceae bacterium]